MLLDFVDFLRISLVEHLNVTSIKIVLAMNVKAIIVNPFVELKNVQL